MADTQFPDKWVRKAIYDAFNGTLVEGETIGVFDFSVPAVSYPDHHVLISTQFNAPNNSHCGRGWTHRVQLDVTTTFPRNTGSRLLGDQIVEALLPSLDSLSLDPLSNMEIVLTTITFPRDIMELDDKNAYFRKIISVELEIR